LQTTSFSFANILELKKKCPAITIASPPSTLKRTSGTARACQNTLSLQSPGSGCGPFTWSIKTYNASNSLINTQNPTGTTVAFFLPLAGSYTTIQITDTSIPSSSILYNFNLTTCP
jgi:hypothetical protein